MSWRQQYFYQILGYKGHILPRYWNSKIQSKEWHEFAQEAPATDAIAGPDSPLWVKTDPEGNPTTPFIELVLGVKSWGAISLLAPEDCFLTYIKPRMGYISPTRSCPDPYPTSQYISLSPIRFTGLTELQTLFGALRPKKPSKTQSDDSKINKQVMESHPKPGRGHFEQARLLWHILIGGRTDLPELYGLRPLPSSIRLAYLAHTLWIDPPAYDILNNDEVESLDIGWYERLAGGDLAKHYIIEEHSLLKKSSKAEFAHGESTTLPESEISSTLSALLAGSNGTKTLILVTHDWPRTKRLLQSLNIDTSAANWHEGLGEFFGFERSDNEQPAPPGRGSGGPPNPPGPGRGARRQSEGSRSGTRGRGNSYVDLDSKHALEFERKVKPETEDVKPKMYDGRYDSPSSVRDRSLSPRSRTRPLADTRDRYYDSKPLFRPDQDLNDGEIEEGQISNSENTPQGNTTAAEPTQIYVVDVRELFTTLITTQRQYILYPPLAHRLGMQFDGWCAGNQARQMHDVLESLVGGNWVYKREEELKTGAHLAPAPNYDSDSTDDAY